MVNCHECAMDGRQGIAVAICRFCMVGLGKHHLVESFRGGPVPQYGCRHQPAAPLGDVAPAAAPMLKVHADPTRWRILLALLRGEPCRCELVDELGLAQNLVCHHVRSLRDAGPVREGRDQDDARWVYYRIDLKGLGGAWSAMAGAIHPSRVTTGRRLHPAAAARGRGGDSARFAGALSCSG